MSRLWWVMATDGRLFVVVDAPASSERMLEAAFGME